MYLNSNIAEAVAENVALYFILNVSSKVTMTLYYARISTFGYVLFSAEFQWFGIWVCDK